SAAWMNPLHEAVVSRICGELIRPSLIMENATNQQARCTLQDRGGGSTPDPSLMLNLAPTLGIDISPGYTERVIRKYYGRTDA
ncbi:hypothetical protein KWH04_23640, partial [Xanthomonas campestris pv. trichodesmae]|nr:hypothetical protein [Xanthomonas campestris pv. trichodesmae]